MPYARQRANAEEYDRRSTMWRRSWRRSGFARALAEFSRPATYFSRRHCAGRRFGSANSIRSRDLSHIRPMLRRYMPGTAMFNMSGQPAMSVPLAWNAAGLPLGMMFAARSGDEATLFRLAAQLEQECPWAGRRPPVCASRAWRRKSG